MINFRYHVVSLTAVFLSLAIGLVVGTAALNGPVADSLNEQVNGLRKHNEQLREQVNSLTDEINKEEDYVMAAAPLLLDDLLTGHRILLVTLPSGRDHADGVIERLQEAGAKVTGRIDFQDKFVEPDHDNDLMSLAESAAQPTVPTDGLPGNSNGVETSSALLATALLDRPAPETVTDEDRKAVLNAYVGAGFLNVANNKIDGSAEAVVVVSGQSYVDKNAAQKDTAVVTMVGQFSKAAPLTVAGSGTGNGNLVSTVRGDPALSKAVSTVDNANTPMGQVCTALAAAEQIKPRRAGHYGLGNGATLLPKPN
ncbi:MAG TPA: copper transporter [Micromonosporaceae bacterium]|nr:copper transporter [Micromonosporaceae bacterium]